MLASIEHTLGRPDEAVKLAEEALRRARQLKHSLSLAFVLHSLCVLHYKRHEPEAARELAKAEIALAEENGFPDFLLSGRALKAWAMSERGQTESGIAELETIADSAQTLMLLSKSTVLAHAYLHVGRAAEAIAIVDEELAGIERSGAYLEAAELHRLKGEAILMRDSSATAEVEACLRKAIEIASGQSAKWWELRATTSLGRLLAKLGKRGEAHTMLSDIYNWFTEGFDTADLKDAKALLDELSA